MNGGIHHAAAHKMAPFHKGSTATNITTSSSLDDPETPSDPAQVKFFPKSESQRSARNWFRRWTKKERNLLVLCGLLFVLCVVFVVIAFTRDRQYRERISQSNKVCTSRSCVTTAAQIMAGMDFTADPCNDFFQYACGQWNKKHVIPEEKATYNTFDKLYDENQIIMRALLEEPVKQEDGEAVMKAKLLYKSCVNITQIEAKGSEPLKEVIKDVGGWPILDPNWDPTNFALEHVLGKIRGKYNGYYLLHCGVSADDKNSSVNILQMDQALLVLPSREYYLLKDHAHQKTAYGRLIRDIAKILGATGPDVQKQIDNIVSFETRIANATSPSEQKHDTGALYHKMTVRELQELIPTFNVLKYLREFVLDEITEEEPIVLFATQYIQDVIKIIHETDSKTVANYIVWRLIEDLIPEFSEPFLEAQSHLKLAIQGVNKNEIRWMKCVEYVNQKMGIAVGAMFIKDNFKKESKETALEMIHGIREAFNELLEENDWMDDTIKQFAKEKANAMVERIGYPDFITDPKQLDARFDSLVLSDDFLDNNLKILAFQSRKMISRLRHPVDRENWEQEPVVVNAFYNPNANDIVFPAGILQPSFYSSTFPKSLNFGGIGVVIGHEITHGFDDKGRQYDKDGNIKQWWDEKTIEAFRHRAQCFVDQYSNYKLEQINEYMNGRITQGENIADNGGLKQSYRAYVKWIEKNGEEPALPGIGLNHHQLFFLNYAQIWCGKMRDEEAVRKIRISAHSLGPIRVYGPLSNSKEFAKAFNCTLGSKMNPVHKCSVW
ncbi:18S rRNA pseudouridine methyltransferase [Bulinus truncatus]|nr:18S rRNA pseudouridine methyltransferase [Bulinus truncatus]